MSGRWTHAACETCFELRHPGYNPTKLREPDKEKCCYCGQKTKSGIYDREDPATTLCKGVHSS